MKALFSFHFFTKTVDLEVWVVYYMNHSSEAHEAGVEIGDTITTINGRDVKDYTWDEEEALHKAPRHELDIVTPQGQQKHVILDAKEYW